MTFGEKPVNPADSREDSETGERDRLRGRRDGSRDKVVRRVQLRSPFWVRAPRERGKGERIDWTAGQVFYYPGGF